MYIYVTGFWKTDRIVTFQNVQERQMKKLTILFKSILSTVCVAISLTFLPVMFHIAAFLLSGIIPLFITLCKIHFASVKRNGQQIDRFAFLGGKGSYNGG